MIRALILLVLVAPHTLLAPLHAQEPGADAVVTLPLAEYEALLANPAGQPEEPPVPWAVREARYECEVEALRARVTARIQLDVLRDGFHQLPVAGGGLVWTRAALDGNDVLLYTPQAGEGAPSYAVLQAKRGAHELALEFTAPIADSGSASRRLAFAVPRSPIASATLLLDAAPVRVQPAAGVVRAVVPRSGGGAAVTLALPPVDHFAVSWVQAAAAPATGATTAPAGATRATGTVQGHYRFDSDRLRLEALATWVVRQGALSEVALTIPPGCRLLRVREALGEATPPFETKTGPQGTRVSLRGEPITGERRVRIELEQLYAEPVRSAPAAVPTSSAAAAGATTATTAVTPAPRTTVPLPFVTLEGVEPNGEFQLQPPDPPLAMEPNPPTGAVRPVVPLTGTTFTAGPTFGYAGAPVFAVQLWLSGTLAAPALKVGELHARSLLLAEGGLVTRASWTLRNASDPTLTVSLPPGARVLSAFLDHEPVRLGARGAAPAPAGEVVLPPRPDPRPAPEAAPPPPSAVASAAATTSTSTSTSATSATLPTTNVAPGATAVTPEPPAPWRELVVPLRQGESARHLEITYREPSAPLGNRSRTKLRLPRTLAEVGAVRWEVDVPAGWSSWVDSGLKAGEPVERAEAPVPVTTSTSAPPSHSADLPSTAAVVLPVRFDLPEPLTGTRHTLTGESVKPDAVVELELVTVSTGVQHAARTLVFLLTLVLMATLYWSVLSEVLTAVLAVVLIGTVLISAVLGLGVMQHLFAGVLAGLTFTIIRQVLEPAEERE